MITQKRKETVWSESFLLVGLVNFFFFFSPKKEPTFNFVNGLHNIMSEQGLHS